MLNVKKANFSVCIMSIIAIILLSIIGNNLHAYYEKNRSQSHGELVNYVNKYYLQPIKASDYKLELEKDVGDMHLMILSYNGSMDSGQISVLAIFRKLENGKYKYDKFEPCRFGISTTILTEDLGTKDKKIMLVYGEL